MDLDYWSQVQSELNQVFPDNRFQIDADSAVLTRFLPAEEVIMIDLGLNSEKIEAKSSNFPFLVQFLTLKNMITKLFQNSDFSNFLGIKSEMNQ